MLSPMIQSIPCVVQGQHTAANYDSRDNLEPYECYENDEEDDCYDDDEEEDFYYDDADYDEQDECLYDADMSESDQTTSGTVASEGSSAVEVSPESTLLDVFGGARLAVASLHVKNYFLEHSAQQIEGYDKEFTRAVRDDDVEKVRRLHREEGHLLQVANRFGESIIHMACRRGSLRMVRFLVEEGGASLRVRDDYGRTPLHDACWTPNPQMQLLQYLLQREPEMLWMKDARGFTPLGYVRHEHWQQWNLFLAANRDFFHCNGRGFK